MSKNTRNRILLTAVAALLLVAVTVAGTIAYLQDNTKEVVNTFTNSKIDVGLEENGSSANDATVEKSFQFIPSVNIEKQPTVSSDSDVPYYVFVEVKVENWPWFADVTDTDTGNYLIDYELNIGDSAWLVVPNTENFTNLSGTVVLYQKLDANAKLTNFPVLKPYDDGKEIFVSKDLTKEQLATITKTPTMTFTSYAIQQANGDSTFAPEAAWAQLSGN